LKIGIVTFHNVPNYGAVLQAFALRKTIKDITGEQVQIIHHQSPGNDDSFLVENFGKRYAKSNSKLKSILKSLVYHILIKPDYSKKSKKFVDFRNNYLELDKSCCIADFDIVVCGSDQIWNPGITQGLDKEYFGFGATSAKKISYAASCGDVSTVKECEDEFLSLVSNMGSVGVREKSLSDFLIAHGINARQTVDPTFLLDKNDYVDAFNLKPPVDSQPYLLVYALQYDKALYSLARQIANKKGLRIKYVCGFVKGSPLMKGKFDCGPIDFLNLLYGADHILTNSFHGMAFSIIFRKAFNVVLPNSRKSRVIDFLESIGLSSRIVNQGKTDDFEDVDYQQIESALNMKIKCSKEFLQSALGVK